MVSKTRPVKTSGVVKATSRRFKAERERLGLSHVRVADISGYAKTTVISWEKGSKIPDDALSALAREGMDVLFVLVGHSANAPQAVILDPDEVGLIDDYRACDDANRNAVRMLATAAAANPKSRRRFAFSSYNDVSCVAISPPPPETNRRTASTCSSDRQASFARQSTL